MCCLSVIKADQLDSLKKSLHFVWNVISWINKNPPGGNFVSGAVWYTNYTIVFKVPAFFFWGGGILVFGSKTDWRDDLVENAKLNPNVVFVTHSVHNHCWCSFTIHSS